MKSEDFRRRKCRPLKNSLKFPNVNRRIGDELLTTYNSKLILYGLKLFTNIDHMEMKETPFEMKRLVM